MTTAVVTNTGAARSERSRDQVVDRLLVWLPALIAVGAVAAYLAIHRVLVLRPGGELLTALASPGWVGSAGVFTSFALVLAPPAALLAALTAVIWPWSRLYDRRPTLRLLATLTAASAVIVLLQVALGSGGILRTDTLAVATLGLTGVLFVSDRARGGVARRRANTASGSPAVLTAGPFTGLAGRLELATPSRLGFSLGLLAAASWLALAAIGALTPPWGWDSLVYHLTDVFWFAQTGALESFPHPAHQFHFPKVAELHALWFYLLAGGGADAWRVTGIALLPLALTAGVAVRAAGELLGLRSALAWLAPATMLVPLALIQPLAGYTDLAFTAFLLAGFTFLLAAVKRGHTADWALAALACGLALGSKLSFVYLCLPLLLLLTMRSGRKLRPRVLLRIPLCGLLAAIGCGFWLIPNLLRTGNPFHPVAVTVGGRTLLEGPATVETGDSNRERYTDSLAGWLIYPLRERFLDRLEYSTENGFGPQFAAAWLTLPFALALALRRRSRLLTRALLAAPATLIAWLLFSPFEHPRYVLTACGFALLGLAAIEEAASGGPGASPAARRLLRSAVVVALLFAAPAGLLAAGGPDLPRVVERWKAGDWQPTEIYPQIYGAAGRAFNWISDQGGVGTTVSFDQHTFVAPLFGWHGRNRVVYAASLAERGVDGLPIAGSSRGWRRFLERERVDLLVVWNTWWEESPEETLRQGWIAAHPEGFEEIATFGPRARVLAPRALGAAVAGTGAGGSRPLAELSSGKAWVLEYSTGATVEAIPDPAGGLRVNYQFLTSRPDYLDLRFDLDEGDWAPDSRLVFGLESPSGSPLLWIYLKEADERRNCRFRIEPRTAAAGLGEVVIELARPQAQTPGFSIRRVASVHLVLDDAGGTRASSGSIRLHDFRLEPAGGASPPTRSSFKEDPS